MSAVLDVMVKTLVTAWLICLAICLLILCVGEVLAKFEKPKPRPCRHDWETLDRYELDGGWLVFRCLDCGTTRELGCALKTATNKRVRRAS